MVCLQLRTQVAKLMYIAVIFLKYTLKYSFTQPYLAVKKCSWQDSLFPNRKIFFYNCLFLSLFVPITISTACVGCCNRHCFAITVTSATGCQHLCELEVARGVSVRRNNTYMTRCSYCAAYWWAGREFSEAAMHFFSSYAPVCFQRWDGCP